MRMTHFVALLLSVALFASLACTPKTAPVDKSEANSLPALASLAQEGKALVLDVREESELNQGMAEPAVWMPMSKINANSPEWQQVVEKNKDKTFAVYCAAGGRAGVVVDMLERKGIKAVNMGGFSDWKRAALPVKTGLPNSPGH